MTLSRDEIIEITHKKLGLSKAACAELLETLLDIVAIGLVKEKVVKIPKFGSFYNKKKLARLGGRNPKTNQEHIITARNVITFYQSKID